ncbi:MAG: hypothetical protein ACLP62_06775 [Acidimicrobiales bacterium]
MPIYAAFVRVRTSNMDAVAAGRPRGTRDAAAGVRVGDFDAGALFEALDRQRLERTLSWRQVADAIWSQSCELNVRRNDHPVAVETIRGMPRRNNVSCQHALFMLRWIGRAPEDFIAHPVVGSAGVGLPVAGPDRRLRWNLGALYNAMNARRRDEGLTWKALADLLGCTQNQLTGIKTARFATGMRLAMRITQWLARPATEFIYAARW